MSVQLQDTTKAPVTTSRFSSTQAIFQFATLSIVVIAGILVAGALSVGGIKPGAGRLLLLGSCVLLVLPAMVAAKLIIDALAASGAERVKSAASRIGAIIALIGLSLALLLAASLQRESAITSGLMDAQRDNARFLFGLDDLSDARLVNYVKQDGRVEAEFVAAGQSISIVVTPSSGAAPATTSSVPALPATPPAATPSTPARPQP